MKLPTMVIIFNRKMADKLPKGIVATFTGHATMWLDWFNTGHKGFIKPQGMNNYGLFESGCVDSSNEWKLWKWSDYRKLVMTSPETIEQLFEKFKKAEVPVYIQMTSHDINGVIYVRRNSVDCCSADAINYKYSTAEPICLAVFLWKGEHKKLLEGMELM
jgi:hypothetical protein